MESWWTAALNTLSASIRTVLIWIRFGYESLMLQVHLPAMVKEKSESSTIKSAIPVSVNYHYLRTCNYSCGFCFHTAKTSFVLPLEEAKRGLRMLTDKGMKKINFSGGEPFLKKQFLGECVMFCKKELKLESVSIVSNGSLITEDWFAKYGEYLDILAISCDSFHENTNKRIGRHAPRKHHIDQLFCIRAWCNTYKVAFKINSVINTFNWREDMSDSILELAPCRWKVFQCLIIRGENTGLDALRQAEEFVITAQQFDEFLRRHQAVKVMVPESNEKMRDSYLILDEYMRFLDCTGGDKKPSKSLLDVGVDAALQRSGFDEKMFFSRGGRYTWSKADLNLEW